MTVLSEQAFPLFCELLSVLVKRKFTFALFLLCYLCDWLAKLAPLSQPMRSKTKTTATCSPSFSRALRRLPIAVRLPVFDTSFDWLLPCLRLL